MSRRGIRGKDWRRATFPRACAVSSPLGPLTSVFGMGTGVTSPPRPPARLKIKKHRKVSDLIGSRPISHLSVLFRFFCFRLGRELSLPAAEKSGQASRPISTGWLKPLLVLHLRPIYPVIFRGPSGQLLTSQHHIFFLRDLDTDGRQRRIATAMMS